MSQGATGGSIRGGKIQHASVFVTENGLTFQVYGVGRQSRATVDLSAGLFSEFYVAEQNIVLHSGSDDDDDDNGQGARTEVVKGGEFGINLTTVLGCLCILGPSSLDRTTLCLSYDTSAAIFKIELLEEAGIMNGGGVIISNCAIPGMSADGDGGFEDEELGNENGLDYAFRSDPIVARARLKSDFLKSTISELTDVAGATSVTVGVSKIGLELATFGHSTECHIVVPYQGNYPEIFLSLEGAGDDDSVHARNYPMHSFLSAMRGLEIANETCISINANGMVAIQHQVLDKVGNGDPNYFDFIMGCLMNEDDDDENNDDGNHNASQMWGQRSQMTTESVVRDAFTPVDDDDGEHDELHDTPTRSQSQQTHGRSHPHPQALTADSAAPKPASVGKDQGQRGQGEDRGKEDEFDGEETEDEPDESQSQGLSLFGVVASVGSNKKRESSRRNIRRKLNESHELNNISRNRYSETGTRTESEEESEEEAEFEDSIDVTASAVDVSRRRSTRNADTESISSPQLMYGDTNLEVSDEDEK